MRSDLLKAISSSKDVTNAVVLTHNIDFVFLQTVVLRAFRHCGQPTLTVFADAQCAAESYAHQRPALSGLGTRYRVVPVAMEPGFRFHPKAVLLSGPEECTLFVGSGNLTFGGWRENAEVWVKFTTGDDGTAPFAAFREYLNGVLQRIALREAVTSEIGEAFDAKTKGWATSGLGTGVGLIGRIAADDALIDQMLGVEGTASPDQLFVCCPYFDKEGEALGKLIERVGARETHVFVQPSKSTLTRQAWKTVGKRAKLFSIDFFHDPDAEEPRHAFVHAKHYAFVSGEVATVFAGSANCSRAALTIPGSRGNAELLAVQKLTRDEYEELFREELAPAIENEKLRDKNEVDGDTEKSRVPALRVLAARYERGHLLVGFSPSRAEIEACVVDGKKVVFVTVEPGVVRATCHVEPQAVTLRGVVNGETAESALCWVDHEQRLRSSARGRSLADSIRDRLQPGEWNVGAWTEVMDVFCKHLAYLPAQDLTGDGQGKKSGDGESEAEPFTAQDVFASDYEPPGLQSFADALSTSTGGRVQSLQQLLLRWFGIPVEEEEDAEAGDEEVDEGDAVDKPERLLSDVPPPPPEEQPEVSERDRRRIRRILDRLTEAMTTEEFLRDRSPGYLAGDLKVAAVLLRTGLREGWVDEEEFFEVTHAIWSSLFFSSNVDPDVGWLEHRAAESEDREVFIEAMRSPDLSAALFGWVTALSATEAGAEGARFSLSVVLAAARVPWLWQGGEGDEIARELGLMLNLTGRTEEDWEQQVATAERVWQTIMRRGQALVRLERATASYTPAELRARITQPRLVCGELLWQGKSGFGVVAEERERADQVKVPVLKLSGEGELRQFMATYTVPLRAMLDTSVVPLSKEFGEEPRKVLVEMIEEASHGLGDWGKKDGVPK